MVLAMLEVLLGYTNYQNYIHAMSLLSKQLAKEYTTKQENNGISLNMTSQEVGNGVFIEKNL